MEHINLSSSIFDRVKALIQNAKRHRKLQIALNDQRHVPGTVRFVFLDLQEGPWRNHLGWGSLLLSYLTSEQTAEKSCKTTFGLTSHNNFSIGRSSYNSAGNAAS